MIAIHIVFEYVDLKSLNMHSLHSSYWFLMFLLMALALCEVVVGRIDGDSVSFVSRSLMGMCGRYLMRCW